ncbi:uncharacterized protein IL334_001251 [Kwoniella shivajii]|uniref:Zn(2)-C6 fungal-type domain-containing protein n=1 Tax=Kwoniella shivajii TaxID=564305 RepID=A0ABZ1CSH7_9TREE|nr:hypothetical protein IL334_001251 [Kwoniella shivajii]
MATEETKKKRRQNVACDGCKFRRVRCDLSDLLASRPSSSSSSPTPLSSLVEQHPEVGCTNCKSKGINCSTKGIREPTRPNKGGKRIDRARKEFGGEADVRLGNVDGIQQLEEDGLEQDDTGWNITGGLNQGLDQIPFDPSEFLDILPPNSVTQESSLPNPALLNDHNPQPPFSTIWSDLPAHQTPFPPFDPSVFDVNPSSVPLVSDLTSSHPLPPNSLSSVHTSESYQSTAPGTPGNFSEAALIWRQFANNRKEAIHLVHTTGLTPGADGVQLSEEDNLPDSLEERLVAQMSEVSEHGSHQSTDLPDPFNGRLMSPIVSVSTRKSGYNQEKPPLVDTDYQRTPGGEGRKRNRSVYDNGRDGKVALVSQNPWKLFASDSSSHTVRWGRNEAVSEILADKMLGMALGNHLVKTFFQAVHLSYPAISPESFYLEWARAGQRSDRMTPSQEALCAVIEAWGARYSDSPVVLGLSEAKANTAPKVIQADGTFIPGTRARTHWGRARLAACKALLDRAKRLIDENGIYRQPSITGVQALTLYSQLMHMTDQKVLDNDHCLQTRMVHCTIIEQMSILGLMWDADGPIVTDDTEAAISFSQLQMKQRRLFWTHMVGDAFFSASIGMLPKIPQEDVDAAGEWIEIVRERLPHSSFKLLAFFLSIYHRLGLAGREVAVKVSYPLRKKGSADVGKICMAVRRIWKDIRGINKDLIVHSADLMGACHKDDLLGFSPLNFLANLRLSCPFLLLVIHQLIRDQLAFWKEVHPTPAFITTPSDGSGNSHSSSPTYSDPSSATSGQPRKNRAGKENVELLERLNKESVDALLLSCRGQVRMLESIIPTGVIQSASIMLRVLIATAQLLAEVPTNEQGYPDITPGGYGWTWNTKQAEVNICVEALHQVGWAWADVGDTLDSVALTMERMTPSPDILAAYTAKQQDSESKPSNEIIRMREEDNKASEKSVNAVLAFWPPISIPQLIEKALSRNRNAMFETGLPGMTNHLQQTRWNKSPARTGVRGRPIQPSLIPIPPDTSRGDGSIPSDPTDSRSHYFHDETKYNGNERIGEGIRPASMTFSGMNEGLFEQSADQSMSNADPQLPYWIAFQQAANLASDQNVPTLQDTAFQYPDFQSSENLSFINPQTEFWAQNQLPANAHLFGSTQLQTPANVDTGTGIGTNELDVEAFLTELGLDQMPLTGQNGS